jgi:dihydrodipicolinate synthase/N-acetylneuraminate lyase
MENATTLRLSSISNIIGIKDATGDLARGKALIEQVPADFAVYSGDDPTAVDLILLGGKGNISVTANVAPAKTAKAAELALQGKAAEAKAVDASLLGLHKNLFLESNPIPVKWACEQLGLCDSGIRLPLTYFADSFHAPVIEAMKQAEVID